MRLTVHADPRAFLTAAGGFLTAHEAANNLVLGLAATLIEQPDRYGTEPAYFAVVVGDGGQVLLAALRTPPHNLVLSMTDDPTALEVVADDVVARSPDLPGVLARADVAHGFSVLWQRATGRTPRLATSERIYQLEQVTPPRPAPGILRPAVQADRSLLIEWVEAFSIEALGASTPGAAERQVNFNLASEVAGHWLWIDGGAPVCLAGSSGPTPTGIRIGPVYTPPPQRRRGYASALVAALSQHHLDAGRARCFLFTNLANPTSNSIYQTIGYRPVCDVSENRVRLRQSGSEVPAAPDVEDQLAQLGVADARGLVLDGGQARAGRLGRRLSQLHRDAADARGRRQRVIGRDARARAHVKSDLAHQRRVAHLVVDPGDRDRRARS